MAQLPEETTVQVWVEVVQGVMGAGVGGGCAESNGITGVLGVTGREPTLAPWEA